MDTVKVINPSTGTSLSLVLMISQNIINIDDKFYTAVWGFFKKTHRTWTCSSVGQSTSLIMNRSLVRAQAGPPIRRLAQRKSIWFTSKGSLVRSQYLLHKRKQLSWQSTTLPRSGSRVRASSSAQKDGKMDDVHIWCRLVPPVNARLVQQVEQVICNHQTTVRVCY